MRTPKQIRDALPFVGGVPDIARRELVGSMYAAGLTLRQVATELGISYQAVYALLKRSGVPIRPRGGSTGGHSRHRK